MADGRYPFITLEKALARAEMIFNGDKSGRPMPVSTAFQLWAYSPKSSGGFQTVGALKLYGLMEDEGANDDRKVKLTPEARRYFLDERDEVRAGMLAVFALRPPLFQALWSADHWNEGIPADTVARSHLKIERGLNDQSARSALGIFKENFVFAGLKGPTIIQPEPLDSPPTAPQESKPAVEPTSRSAPMEAQQPWPVAVPSAPEGASQDVRLIGDRVIIAANVDLKGLRKLRRQLAMFEQMLTMDDDNDEGASPAH